MFEKYGKSSSKSQVPTAVAAAAGIDHDSIDTLKRRVKELEGVLSTHVHNDSLVPIPIPTFSACNIEKVGIGMGMRLHNDSL